MTEKKHIIPEKVIELIKQIFSKNNSIMNYGLDYKVIDELFIKETPITEVIRTFLNPIKKLNLGDKDE